MERHKIEIVCNGAMLLTDAATHDPVTVLTLTHYRGLRGEPHFHSPRGDSFRVALVQDWQTYTGVHHRGFVNPVEVAELRNQIRFEAAEVIERYTTYRNGTLPRPTMDKLAEYYAVQQVEDWKDSPSTSEYEDAVYAFENPRDVSPLGEKWRIKCPKCSLKVDARAEIVKAKLAEFWQQRDERPYIEVEARPGGALRVMVPFGALGVSLGAFR